MVTMVTPKGYTEPLIELYRHGGKAALLSDLYLDAETLRLTNWDEPLKYDDPINGSSTYYSPAPFAISENAIENNPLEANVITVRFGLIGYDSGETEFTAAQLAKFSQLMYDLEEWLDRNDIRGALTILRLVNPDNLTADKHLFTGLVDDFNLDDQGMTLDLANHDDILSAPTYPISRMCPYRFGETRCGIDATAVANKYSGTAEAGSSTTLIVDSSISPSSDDYWLPGIVTCTSGNNENVSREVADYVNSTKTITVSVPFDNAVATGDTFILRRRCKKTYEDCNSTFSNAPNFGGYYLLNEEIKGLFWRGKG